MTTEWKRRILELRYRNTEEEDSEFVSLVDMSEDNCDYDTCKILMKTFVTEEDFGVQESVNRVLSSAKPKDRQKALLEELPRLVIDTPEWAEVLIGTELKFYFGSFNEVVRSIDPLLKGVLDEVLSRQPFREQFPDLRI
jgi:hypothetical protein